MVAGQTAGPSPRGRLPFGCGESRAFGFADRAHGIPNTLETQFGIASGTKGITTLVVNAVLPLDLEARDLLGRDLPLIDDGVTVGHS